jgi:hypothetical protein
MSIAFGGKRWLRSSARLAGGISLWCAGCGETHGTERPSDTAGVGGQAGRGNAAGDAGANSGGSAGTPAQAGSAGSGGAEQPEPGRCIEVLRLEKPLRFQNPKRLQDGFALFGEQFGGPEPQDWFIVNEQGTWWTATYTAETYPFRSPFPAGSAAEPRAIAVTREGPERDHFFARPIAETGELVGEPISVLSIFDRGTADNVTATSLDGERIAVGNGHGAVHDPRIVLLDQDAQPIATERKLLDTDDSPSFRCFELTGTAHGVVASVVDDDLDQLALLELDAQGAVTRQATLALPDGSGTPCPVIQVTPSDLFVSFLVSPDVGSARLVYRAEADSLERVTALPDPPSGTRYRWLRGGDAPLLSLTSSISVVRFATWTGSELAPLQGDFEGTPLPSADGRIFLDSSTAEATRIVEVACSTGN